MKNLITYLSKKSLSLENGSGMTRKWFGNDSGMTRSSLASLICVLMLTLGVGNVWGVDPSWTHTFTTLPSISSHQFTVNSATWTEATVVSTGSPSITLGNDNSVKAMKFGSGAKNCYSSITLSTDYFADYNIKSVYIVGCGNAANNIDITVTQGTGGSAVTIGTARITAAYSASWNSNANCQKTINTNKGNGGKLTISISPTTCAFSLREITVTYEEASSGYAVTYNNGGHGTAPSNTTASAVTLSAITGVTGYTCTGWTANVAVTNTSTSASISAGTLIPNSTGVTLSQATTFTAQWSANNYTISLDQDLTPTSAGTTSIPATYDASTNLTSAITPPTKTDWTFAGYYTEKSGSGTQIIDADGNVLASKTGYTDESKNWKYAGNITLYAKWTCTVTWSVSGATDVYSAHTLTYNATSTKVASIPGPPSPASYCGDKFVGWTTEENVSQNDDAGLGLFTTIGDSPELKTVGNTTFYAVFADYDD